MKTGRPERSGRGLGGRADDPRRHVLPDVLEPGLRIVFCGTAAGTVSARRAAYYAHPQNKFWRTLAAVGLTPRLLRPEDYHALPAFGLGLTDLAKHASGMDCELPAGSLGNDARATLTAKIEALQPRLLAFTSLAAGRSFLGRGVGFGWSGKSIGATRVFVLPSPSPAAHWNFDESWWRKLADEAAVGDQGREGRAVEDAQAGIGSGRFGVAGGGGNAAPPADPSTGLDD